jgi:hypothetical protein
MSKLYNIIVSTNGENLDWVERFDKSNTVIYNISNTHVENSINRQSQGSNLETFLYHIIENYDKLPDYLIFALGNPFLYIKDPSVNINNFKEKIEELLDTNTITVQPLFCDLLLEDVHTTYLSMKTSEYYWLFFNKAVPQNIEMGLGSQYIVSSKNILKRPKLFYEYIHKMICESKITDFRTANFSINKFYKNTMSTWSLERLLFYIYKGDLPLSKQIEQLMNNKSISMDKIVVTPAGRKRYLEILIKYLVKAKKEEQFDRWDLWLNTDVQENIDYCEYLSKTYDWINIVKLSRMVWEVDFGYKMTNIFRFFKYASNKDSVYVRLDDDVVYLEPNFFINMFDFRIKNKEPFVVFGNIVNNAVITHLHQRNGLLDINYPATVWYNFADVTGIYDHKFCELLHNRFIDDVKNDKIDNWKTSFKIWKTYGGERVSVNCVSWLGETFYNLDSIISEGEPIDEENWLSVDAPRIYNRYNVIYNDALVAHFAFCTQREKLEAETDILQKYKQLSDLID